MATKRRGQGEGGVYQRCEKRYGCPPTVDGVRPKHRCRGPWCAVLELGKKPNGKRDRKVLTATSKSEVVDKLDEAKRQHGQIGTVATNVPTVDAWFTRWLTEIEVHRVTPKTLRAHRSQIEQLIVPFLGRERLDRLTPSHVLSWQAWARARPKVRGDGTIAESTVLRVHSVLSRALQDALPLGYLPHGNPARQIDRPSAGGQEVAFLDAEQAARLLEHVKDDPYGSRWGFALLNGVRQGETLGLRWSHVGLEQGVADISWQLQRLDYRHGCGGETKFPSCGRRYAGDCPDKKLDVRPSFEHVQLDGALCLTRPKNRKRRTVPLIGAMVAWLRARHQAAAPTPHDLVWTRQGGRPVDLRDDYQAWVDLLAELGYPHRRLHSTRHSCVSLLLSLGVQEPVIMAIVGHSTFAASRRYQHIDQTAARAALQQLAGALRLELPAQPQVGELPDVHAGA